MSTYTIRNFDEKTKENIYVYAQEHDINVAEAIKELVFYGLQHIKHSKKEKKYNSFFDLYDELKFSSDSDLSQKIDEILYDG